MKKIITTLVALVFVAQLIGALEPSATLTVYYASIDGKATNANDDLRKTLCTVISTGYTSISYSGLSSQMFAASSDPTDFVNGDNKTMEDIYSSKPYKSSDNGSSASNCGAGWNKEHTVPQSWFGEATPMRSDAFHVYPTDIKMNSVRSNYPYGETNAAKSCSSWGYGSLGSNTFPGYTGTVFDPGEGGEYGSYKGDLARTYFYMVTRYRTTNFTSGSGSISFSYSGGVADLTDYMKNLMLKWHREDPVSPKELYRNNAVYAHQHNRNPFIDYPELVEYIWGEKKGETVVLADLVSGYDDGGVLPPVPPIPAAMYGITWSVNGETLYVDSLAEETPIQALPAEPVSCSAESNMFMGWTTAPIDGTSDEAPLLYKEPSDFPPVTEDVTYYAVFAKQESNGSVTPAVYTYSINNPSEGWTNTAPNKGSYWLLETGKTIVSPEIDLMGLESITVKMRTYGGSQYNELTISEDDGVLGTVTATAGSTMTEYTWNCMLYIAGTSAITFSSDYGTGKGIGIQEIVINATGAGITYSRFITSCQGTTEVELVVNEEAAARKILVGGQIYILLGGQLFNLQGQRVK